MLERIKNINSLSAIVGPVGKARIYDEIKPNIKLTILRTIAHTITALKLSAIFMALRHGNTINALISNEPVSFIPKTIITEQRIAKTVSYILTFMPTALANSSSKLIAKICL